MLAVAEHLQRIGHDVTFNTAEIFRSKVTSAGIRFVPFAGKANYDYRHMYDAHDGKGLSVEEMKLQMVKARFAEVIPDQYEVIQQIFRDTPVDLVVIDTFFFGIFPMLLGPRAKRPPIIGCGVNPVVLSSADCGLVTPPASTPEEKQQIAAENQSFRETFLPAGELMDSMIRSYGSAPMPHFFVDCVYLLPDVFLQFSPEALEYPRSDMSQKVSYIGPILPKQSVKFEPPSWWPELDGSKPVVLVTQGTLANRDFSELIQPALDGLADEDVLVIVAAGRSDTETLNVPENARVASFIPFDRILPKVDVLVTNGGYGAVNHALSLGVPIVVSGTTEDKDMVSARVAWTGAGINLKTQYANPEEVRNAVRTILLNEQYRNAAQRLQEDCSRYDALAEITRTVDAMLAQNENMAEPALVSDDAR
jgi:MGT family glycosyltransferase